MGRGTRLNAQVMDGRREEQVLGWVCLGASAIVISLVAYGFLGPRGALGISGLIDEPWFLITLADLYLGVLLAMGVLWCSPGRWRAKLAWSILFVLGGHPAVAIWVGLLLIRGRVRTLPGSTGSPEK